MAKSLKFSDLFRSQFLSGILKLQVYKTSFFINSRTAIAGAIIGLLLVFFRRRDFCHGHMTSQPLQICFLFIR